MATNDKNEPKYDKDVEKALRELYSNKPSPSMAEAFKRATGGPREPKRGDK